MARPPKPYVPFAEPVAYRIIAGLASGRGLRAICRGPDMPTRPTVMRWLKERPGFAHDVAAARAYGGLDRPGRPSLYGEALMEAIYMRLCAGEPLRTICRDPRMPGRSTVQGWAKHRAKAARLLALGHDVGRHMAAERQWEVRQGTSEAPASAACRHPRSTCDHDIEKTQRARVKARLASASRAGRPDQPPQT